MSKGNTFENDFLLLIFNAVAIANIADNASVSPLTDLFWSLATSDPGEGGDQATNEAAYTSYVRVTVARTAGGHTVTANSMSPTSDVDFPPATGGGETETHFTIGVAVSGASKILYYGTVTPNIVVTAGVTPRLATASTVTED
jgi:hypothetical protein